MKLRLGEAKKIGHGPIYNSGYEYYYDVLGAPREEGFAIARKGDDYSKWRIGVIKDGRFGWSGEFDTPEEALAELQAEVDSRESHQR